MTPIEFVRAFERLPECVAVRIGGPIVSDCLWFLSVNHSRIPCVTISYRNLQRWISEGHTPLLLKQELLRTLHA